MKGANAQRLVALQIKIDECIGESIELESQMVGFSSMKGLNRKITQSLEVAHAFIEKLEARKKELGLG